MKPSTLFSTAAIYLILVGLGFLFIPGILTFGALGGTPAVIVAELRQYGGALLGIAVLNWVARNAEPSKARDGVFLGNTVGFGLVAIGGVLRQLSGAVAIRAHQCAVCDRLPDGWTREYVEPNKLTIVLLQI